jgi:uncharacterized membrane protein
MTDLLEFLLGYNLIELSQGEFFFGTPVNLAVIISGIVLFVIVVYILYRQTTVTISAPLKLLLVSLKALVLSILFLCLLKPLLVVSNIIPQESYLALMVDNSRSMDIKDMEKDKSRGQMVSEFLYRANGMTERLQEIFRLRTFSFDSNTSRISGEADLSFTGSKTSIAQGLEHVIKELKGLPLSGVVLMTDGGDNSNEDSLHTARLLKSLDIPVFTIGVGQEHVAIDHEIIQVKAAKTVMEDSIFDVHVTVGSRGYEGRELELLIEQDDKIVASKRIKVEQDLTIRRHTLELTPEKEGNLIYTVRIPEQTDEIITENNKRTFLVNNEIRRSNILYFEGHPRNEYKFIRRAVEDDKSLRLVSHLQTGPQKFLRQGIESPLELASSFPASAEELYKYEAIILGDISRASFSDDQLSLVHDYVSERGGGLLMLASSYAFEEGFIETPISDLLPVTLLHKNQLPLQLRGGARKGDHPTGREFKLRLTDEGKHSVFMRLGPEGEENRQLWDKMPLLQGINVSGRAKPGATVLAIHPALSYNNAPLPVIAYQRFGRGHTIAIMTASTWRWQMLMPHEDTSHERFWRQLLRWLAAESPPQVELALDHDSYSVGEQVQVRVSVSDKAYSSINDATVWLKITDAAGGVQDMQLEWAIDEEGIYTGAFVVEQDGMYNLEATSATPSREFGKAPASFLVTESNVEYKNPGMDATLLARIAKESGGKFYPINNADRLEDDLAHIPNEYSIKVEHEIWDVPLVLLLLISLFSLEWLIRRRRGMS